MIEFELALFDPDKDDVYYSLSDYLKNPQALPAYIDLRAIAILVNIDGTPLVRGWNFGVITLLLLQIEAVIERLEADKIALLRSGIDEQTVPYFLFRPVSTQEVAFSLFILEDERIAYVYPIPQLDGKWQELYHFVEANPAKLNYDRNDNGVVLKDIICSTAELLAVLRRELAIGYNFKQKFG